MVLGAGLFVLLVTALLALQQARTALGAWHGTGLGALVAMLLGGAWCGLEWDYGHQPVLPEDMTTSVPVSPEGCVKCHESHYRSWQRTYHRTMTRQATPEFVKADFNDAVFEHLGVTSRMSRRGDRFFIETVQADSKPKKDMPLGNARREERHVFPIDLVVGSHWFQQMMAADDQGRYLRLPQVYHLVEKRWIHISGAFLEPDTGKFFHNGMVWNESCLFCHNTRVSKNAVPIPGQPPGYRTTVAELGISCEACHGAGERHVVAHRNPARRLAQHSTGDPDPTIVNPARLPVARGDDVCARCHGSLSKRREVWDPNSQPDPFLPGRDLSRFFTPYWSEAEMRRRNKVKDPEGYQPPPDGRFWGDGTPLTTALEYQGMALSACYQGGQGDLRCTTCHSMHASEPNHQLKAGMRTNTACYGCHDAYRTRLVEHTHHPADSQGSLCYNCHMPYQVYSLLSTHRSHRIAIPRVRDSLGTGKPHACNLCHLDKSLSWTTDYLKQWYGTKPEALSADDHRYASSLLDLARGDARTRAVVAGAFSWPPAQEAGGRDWPSALLVRTLEHERYAAVRYLAQRALRTRHGQTAEAYNYLGTSAERVAQLRDLRAILDNPAPEAAGRYPFLPFTAAGHFADDVFDRLLRTRNDPEVYINE
jgi:predicted CXXCH cytochrome family protein